MNSGKRLWLSPYEPLASTKSWKIVFMEQEEDRKRIRKNITVSFFNMRIDPHGTIFADLHHINRLNNWRTTYTLAYLNQESGKWTLVDTPIVINHLHQVRRKVIRFLDELLNLGSQLM
jgi:predicted unusual protein kinase regulating ubiquinone biosynthesis (AarF/ABC1/UbiB family)